MLTGFIAAVRKRVKNPVQQIDLYARAIVFNRYLVVSVAVAQLNTYLLPGVVQCVLD